MTSYANAASFDPNHKVVYSPEKDMFPPAMYERSIKNCLTNLCPSKSTYLFRTVQTLYKDNPKRFYIVSGLHQNDENDVMHYSIKIQLEHCSMLLHFNGYYKTFFVIRNITTVEAGETKLVADFVKYQDETL
jgi:hypothetical protein